MNGGKENGQSEHYQVLMLGVKRGGEINRSEFILGISDEFIGQTIEAMHNLESSEKADMFLDSLFRVIAGMIPDSWDSVSITKVSGG